MYVRSPTALELPAEHVLHCLSSRYWPLVHRATPPQTLHLSQIQYVILNEPACGNIPRGLADVGVKLVKPPPEAFVVLGVTGEVLSGIDDAVETCEMLEEGAGLRGGVLEGRVVGELGTVFLVDFSNGVGVAEVFLEHANEPGQASPIV